MCIYSISISPLSSLLSLNMCACTQMFGVCECVCVCLCCGIVCKARGGNLNHTRSCHQYTCVYACATAQQTQTNLCTAFVAYYLFFCLFVCLLFRISNKEFNQMEYSEPTRNISTTPSDVLLKIITYLTFKDTIKLQLVNKQFLQLLKLQSSWQLLYLWKFLPNIDKSKLGKLPKAFSWKIAFFKRHKAIEEKVCCYY